MMLRNPVRSFFFILVVTLGNPNTVVIISWVRLAGSSGTFSTRSSTPNTLYPDASWAAAFGGRPGLSRGENSGVEDLVEKIPERPASRAQLIMTTV